MGESMHGNLAAMLCKPDIAQRRSSISELAWQSTRLYIVLTIASWSKDVSLLSHAYTYMSVMLMDELALSSTSAVHFKEDSMMVSFHTP